MIYIRTREGSCLGKTYVVGCRITGLERAKVINKGHIQQDVTAHACSTLMAVRLASDFHVKEGGEK